MKHAFFSTAVLAAMMGAACSGTPNIVDSPFASLPNADVSAVVRTLHVGPSLVPCTGVGQETCLQVREAVEAAWTLLHGAIDGFDYEPGFDYIIRVKEELIANPPADASSLRRTLIAILSKTKAAWSLAGTSWRLVAINGREALPGVRVTAEFGSDGRVYGSSGCNRYTGGASAENGRLTVGNLASTRMHCGDVVQPQEDAFLSALGQAKAYRIAGDELFLGPDAGTTTLAFRRE